MELSWETALQQVLTESPEVAAATANVEAAQWAVRRATRGSRSQRRSAGGRDTRYSERRHAHGDRDRRADSPARSQPGRHYAGPGSRRCRTTRCRPRRPGLQTRLAEVFQRHDTARTQVERYARKGGIIDSAEQTLQLIRAGYEVEEFGVLDLLSAQRSYFEARLAYLDSLRLLWDAVLEIQGLLLQDSLAGP